MENSQKMQRLQLQIINGKDACYTKDLHHFMKEVKTKNSSARYQSRCYSAWLLADQVWNERACILLQVAKYFLAAIQWKQQVSDARQQLVSIILR